MTFVPYFNIATRGGSATGWIATILQHHPGVVCLHGRRGLFGESLPPPPAEAVRRLATERARLRASGEGDKSVGIIHVYYDSESRQAFLDAGGTFTSIVRNPLARIHSLFTHHCKLDLQHTPPPGATLYRSLIEADLATGTKLSSLPFVTIEASRPADVLFLGICQTVVDSDFSNITQARRSIVLFERLVTERAYLAAWLASVLGGTDDILERAIDAELDRPQNSHVGEARLSPDAIFDAWPDAYRKLFLFSILMGDWEATLAAYASVGFEFPQLTVELLSEHA